MAKIIHQYVDAKIEKIKLLKRCDLLSTIDL